MASPDAVEILVNLLVGDGVIAPLVTHDVETEAGTVTEVAIYGEHLPRRPLVDPDSVNLPVPSIVVRSFFGFRETDGGLRKPRILIRTYAQALSLASSISSVVDELLHDQTFDVDDGMGGTYRIEVEMSSGPNNDTEEGTNFPFCDRIYSTSVM